MQISTKTKVLLLNLSFTFARFGRDIKYMFSGLARGIRDTYYFYRGDYDLKQFGSRQEKNLTWKWVKRKI